MESGLINIVPSLDSGFEARQQATIITYWAQQITSRMHFLSSSLSENTEKIKELEMQLANSVAMHDALKRKLVQLQGQKIAP